MNLKTKLSLLVILSAVILSTNLMASEIVVATITNDESKTLYKLVIDSAEEDNSIKKFYKDVFNNGKKVKREEIKTIELNKGGIVLEERDGRIILKLKSNNFDLNQGGIIQIDTLYNGINNQRRNYDIQLAKSKSGWSIFKQGRAINQMHIESNKVVFKTVGIKNVMMK